MPVRSDDYDESGEALSKRYGLDQRTVHMLPAKCPEHPSSVKIPFVYPQYDPEVNRAANQAWLGMNNNNSGSSGHGRNYANTPYWRQYAAILEKNGRKVFAKIVIQEDLEPWAKKRGFSITKQFRMYGSINEKMEKTEFSRSDPK